ncbi:MAG TPA: nuclear transport factor 2 family protein, partial [Pyrinomonadaceae bacterium]
SSSSVVDLLAQAELDYGDRSYTEVIKNSREVLAVQPDNARANLLLGLSYLKGKRYTNSTPYLSKALVLGEAVKIPIKHHHYVFLTGDAFCEGYLAFGKNVFEFHSTSQGGHDFSVPFSKIYELLMEQLHGGRLRVKVGIQKEKKEDRKTYNFHLTEAYLSKDQKNIVNAHCNACEQDLQGLFQLIKQLLVLPTGFQDSPATLTGSPADAGGVAAAPPGATNNPILQELLLIERQVFEAAVKGDKTLVAAAVADEFVQTQDGKPYNKAQLLALVKPLPLLRSFSYESVNLSFQGEIAILDGVVAYNIQNERAMVTLRQKFTEQFVKRDGRWLIISSQITTLKK